jgi:hypothetical protein
MLIIDTKLLPREHTVIVPSQVNCKFPNAVTGFSFNATHERSTVQKVVGQLFRQSPELDDQSYFGAGQGRWRAMLEKF